ncbi:MAG TPA: helix-turn-helix transcriptional regulator [Thermoanaerobaculia bacterium]
MSSSRTHPPQSSTSSPLELLGHTVREIRTEKGITQQEVADRCGVNRTFIIAVEKGRQNASTMSLIKISAALGVLPAELFRAFSKAAMRNVTVS